MSAPTDISGLGGMGLEEGDIKDFMHSGMELFTLPNQEKVMMNGKEIVIRPTNAIDDKGPYIFDVPNDGYEFTLLPLTRLHCEFSVRKADGTAPAATDQVGLVNLAPNAMFNQIDILLNNSITSQQMTRNYHYDNFIVTALSYNYQAKVTHLEALHLWKECGEKTGNTEDFTDTGLLARAKWVEKGQVASFNIPLNSPLMHSPRLMKPNVNMQIRLHRNEDSFTLMTPKPTGTSTQEQYRIKIHDIKLYMRRIIVHPAALSAHQRILSSKPVIYPIVNQRVMDTLISKDTSSITLPSIIRGRIPCQAIFGFVSQEAYKGCYYKNPFYFHHYNINQFYTSLNGTFIPQTPFEPDWDNELVCREYRAFMDNTQIYHGNISNGITKKKFMNGYSFFALDYTPDCCGAYHVHEPQHGTIDVHIRFKTPTPEPIIMITFVLFNRELITIDKDGTVLVQTY